MQAPSLLTEIADGAAEAHLLAASAARRVPHFLAINVHAVNFAATTAELVSTVLALW